MDIDVNTNIAYVLMVFHDDVQDSVGMGTWRAHPLTLSQWSTGLMHANRDYGAQRFVRGELSSPYNDPLAQYMPKQGDAILVRCEPVKVRPMTVAWEVDE